ncbi:D-arabinose 1-dehydrogenase (NAD(+)) [Malassezia vespertilionis]|uniref:NADP-dependent oxidoreductase domain-containing protein n=1 Tax=Malassezia vespertilionis TaxID=2020962 RepID=A0A2N1JBH4_9BASI|nr:D-arabinose 1-dehydrogenase (NAD(+)) [Malassezia vespertilionis]PKI83872.1 hypothetical protein MVES_002281 [Malassezia vespertilionis]WFD07057.1 D-arabinose 1-dehydrogenase (NAD(+)) [Malassezia vespertilionis]
MPIPPQTYPPWSAFGDVVPLNTLPDDVPDGEAPWQHAKELTDFKSQCSPLLFGGGAFGAGMYNADTVLHSDACIRALRLAFRYGINALDTSPYYYPSELVLGRALRTLAPEFPRASYFLITKCGRYGPARSAFDYTPERISQSVHDSMERLGTTYLDAALLHDAEFVSDQPRATLDPDGALLAANAVGIACDQHGALTQGEARVVLGTTPADAPVLRGDGDRRVLDAAHALFALKDRGVIKNVGMSGYPVAELVRISRFIACNAPFRPLDIVLNYSNHTLHSDLLPQWQDMFAVCPWPGGVCPDGSGRVWEAPMLLNASPFSMGLFSDRGAPPWHPASPALQETVQQVHARLARLAAEAKRVSVPKENVLGRTALLHGIRGTEKLELRTLLGMSNVEEVHAAIAIYRVLVSACGSAEARAKLDPKQIAALHATYEQLAEYGAIAQAAMKEAHVYDAAWAQPPPDA